MNGTAPLRLHRARVVPEWIDYNGHLSEAYYVLIFGHATDALLDAIGMDGDFRTRTGRSVYTVDARIRYLGEVACGEEVEIRTWVCGADAKRMLVHHAMHRAGCDEPAARTELVLLSVAKPGPRAAPFDPAVFRTIRSLAEAGGASCPVLPDRWVPPSPQRNQEQGD
ncbi:thioesterase family protein [Skermanella sp. TT6]|uniref:Thioesterase family protein n=1 Tax=Skermanella cutis TaxID=2775420 RepID=A0ABX7BFB1_9PROT|nr:thioesterase family protein [Skermanella sp. TT6]QQP91756.1 thioesterase family protein [Skermanella sp. TT6]